MGNKEFETVQNLANYPMRVYKKLYFREGIVTAQVMKAMSVENNKQK